MPFCFITHCLQFGRAPQTLRYSCGPPTEPIGADCGRKTRHRKVDGGCIVPEEPEAPPPLSDRELRWPAISCLSALNNKSQPFDCALPPPLKQTLYKVSLILCPKVSFQHTYLDLHVNVYWRHVVIIDVSQGSAILNSWQQRKRD